MPTDLEKREPIRLANNLGNSPDGDGFKKLPILVDLLILLNTIRRGFRPRSAKIDGVQKSCLTHGSSLCSCCATHGEHSFPTIKPVALCRPAIACGILAPPAGTEWARHTPANIGYLGGETTYIAHIRIGAHATLRTRIFSPQLRPEDEAQASPLPVLVEGLVLLQRPQAHLCGVGWHDLPFQLLQVKVNLRRERVRPRVTAPRLRLKACEALSERGSSFYIQIYGKPQS